MAPSVGISYIDVVLPRLVREKCWKFNQGVMLKVVLGDLFENPLGEKEGRKGAKIGSMNRRRSSMALEKGCFKRIRHCQALRGVRVLTGGTRNWNACVG